MNYVQRREEWIRQGVKTGDDIGTQRTADLIALVLHDPKIMGKDTFGKKRLEKVYTGLRVLEQKYGPAFHKGSEQDYVQTNFDNALREIFEDDMISFQERYPSIAKPK